MMQQLKLLGAVLSSRFNAEEFPATACIDGDFQSLCATDRQREPWVSVQVPKPGPVQLRVWVSVQVPKPGRPVQLRVWVSVQVSVQVLGLMPVPSLLPVTAAAARHWNLSHWPSC